MQRLKTGDMPLLDTWFSLGQRLFAGFLFFFLVGFLRSFFHVRFEEERYFPERYWEVHQAIEFPEGEEWFNVPRPLTIQDLRGHPVLLYFRECFCTDCLRSRSDRETLGEKWNGRIQVVGVQSAIADRERETGPIPIPHSGVGIEYPVLNDSKGLLLARYGVETIPAIVLIDPDGMVRGRYPGEVSAENLENDIELFLRDSNSRHFSENGQPIHPWSVQ